MSKVGVLLTGCSKTGVCDFAAKTNILFQTDKLCDSSVTRTGTITDLGVQLKLKLLCG